MRVHHLNCISACPLGGKLMDAGPESVFERAHLTSHCLLVESSDGLILVDTGYGLADVHDPHSRLSPFFLTLNGPEFREEMTAIRQIEGLGFEARDVRHIVLTHLDFDHAGGLDDFPEARVHMLEAEKSAALEQKTWLDRQRYRPAQWSSKSRWKTYVSGEGETWFGFNRVHQLEGLPEDIALIPLTGHTFGHAGVAVRSGERWLLNAGDAYFFHEEMNVENPRCTPGLQTYQLMMDKDHGARVWNQKRLRELKRDNSDEVEIFCAHDVQEFERLAGHSASVSACRHHSHKPSSSVVAPTIETGKTP